METNQLIAHITKYFPHLCEFGFKEAGSPKMKEMHFSPQTFQHLNEGCADSVDNLQGHDDFKCYLSPNFPYQDQAQHLGQDETGDT